MSRPLAQKATDRLKSIGCELILNERVSSSTDKSVTLKSGKVIDCDLHIPSIREKPYSNFMPSDSIDSRGYIKVSNFKATSLSIPKVFAFGDVTTYDLNNFFHQYIL
jgi:thioredoxin reductase